MNNNDSLSKIIAALGAKPSITPVDYTQNADPVSKIVAALKSPVAQPTLEQQFNNVSMENGALTADAQKQAIADQIIEQMMQPEMPVQEAAPAIDLSQVQLPENAPQPVVSPEDVVGTSEQRANYANAIVNALQNPNPYITEEQIPQWAYNQTKPEEVGGAMTAKMQRDALTERLIDMAKENDGIVDVEMVNPDQIYKEKAQEIANNAPWELQTPIELPTQPAIIEETPVAEKIIAEVAPKKAKKDTRIIDAKGNWIGNLGGYGRFDPNFVE